MISFKGPIQSRNKSSESNYSTIFSASSNEMSENLKDSSDVSVLCSSSVEIKVKKIYVFSRCYSTTKSQTITNFDNSHRSSYEEMTKASKIRNTLISLPFLHVSTTIPLYVQNNAVIKIQSLVRRYLTIRKYYLYEKQRIANRNQIIEDILSKRKTVNNAELPKSQLVVLEKRVRMLINQLKSPNISKQTEKRILSLFFNCVAKGGIISLSDLVFLICNIINIPCTKSEFYNVYDNKAKFRPTDKITFISFSRLFTLYKSTHVMKQRHWYNKMADYLFSEDIPSSFLIKFYSYQTVMYDVIYSLQKYDLVNPKLFSCGKCKYSSVTPLELVKHSLQKHCR